MKNTLRLAAVTLLAAASASAATYTWQTAGTTNTWSTGAGDTNWFVDAGNTLTQWSDANDAVFSGAGETVTLSGTVAPASITVGAGNGDWTFAVSAGNIIGGTGRLTKTGTGTLNFTGSGVQNTFAGTTISQGTVTFTSISGGGMSQLGTGTITLNDTNTGSANTSLIANAGQQLYIAVNVANQGAGVTTIGAASGVGGAWFSNTVTANKAITLQSGGTNGSNTDFSILAGTGDITIANAGAAGAVVRFFYNSASANTNTGNLTINSGAILQLGSGGSGTDNVSQSGMIGDASVVTVNGTLTVARGATYGETIGAFAGSGSVTSNASAAGVSTFTLGNGTGSFSGTISDGAAGKTIAITKNGTGTQTFTGNNTYTGGTIVTAGTLVAGNASALGSGAVTVGGGSLTTSVANVNTGALTVNNAGSVLTLNGAGVGTVTLTSGANLAISAGTVNIDIASVGSFDRILGSGAGTFSITGGTLALSGVIDTTQSYQLLSGFASGSVSGLSITGSGFAGYTASLSNAGVLSFTAVPEPSTYGLAGAGALAAVALVRRRKQK